MASSDRAWLVGHLREQVEHLADLTRAIGAHAGDDDLVALRDQVFVVRETLDSLGVPHALVSNVDWNRAIGTTSR